MKDEWQTAGRQSPLLVSSFIIHPSSFPMQPDLFSQQVNALPDGITVADKTDLCAQIQTS